MHRAVAQADGVAALTPAFRSWEALALTVPGLGTLHFNATFVIGLILMLVIFAIQHRGISSTAKAQRVMAIVVLVPLLVAGLIIALNLALVWLTLTGRG